MVQEMADRWMRNYQSAMKELGGKLDRCSEALDTERAERLRDVRQLFGRVDTVDDKQDTTAAETVDARRRSFQAEALTEALAKQWAEAKAAGAIGGKEAGAQAGKRQAIMWGFGGAVLASAIGAYGVIRAAQTQAAATASIETVAHQAALEAVRQMRAGK
jgi:hypothetical protein